LSQQLIERGFKRVRDLSSRVMAGQVIDVYREVVEASANGRG
jgi:hypothetical protein